MMGQQTNCVTGGAVPLKVPCDGGEEKKGALKGSRRGAWAMGGGRDLGANKLIAPGKKSRANVKGLDHLK